MSVHESVNRLYQKVLQLNPIFTNITQITNYHWLDVLNQLDMPQIIYCSNDSLLFSTSTAQILNPLEEAKPPPRIHNFGMTERHPEILKYESGIPTSFVSYTIVFAIGKSDGKPVLARPFGRQINKDRIKNTCTLHEQFFRWKLSDITYIDCDSECGNGRHEEYSEKNGVWCYLCDGSSINSVDRIVKYLHKSMNFSDMPKESMYYIEEKEEPIDMNNMFVLERVKNIMQGEQQQISHMEINVLSTPNRISQFVREQTAKMNEDKEVMDKLLPERGGTVDAFKAGLTGIDRRIKLLNLIAVREELDKKMATLNKEMSKLTDEMARMDNLIEEMENNVSKRQRLN